MSSAISSPTCVLIPLQILIIRARAYNGKTLWNLHLLLLLIIALFHNCKSPLLVKLTGVDEDVHTAMSHEKAIMPQTTSCIVYWLPWLAHDWLIGHTTATQKEAKQQMSSSAKQTSPLLTWQEWWHFQRLNKKCDGGLWHCYQRVCILCGDERQGRSVEDGCSEWDNAAKWVYFLLMLIWELGKGTFMLTMDYLPMSVRPSTLLDADGQCHYRQCQLIIASVNTKHWI